MNLEHNAKATFIYIRSLEYENSEIKSKLMNATGGEKGRYGKWLLMGKGFFLGVKKISAIK